MVYRVIIFLLINFSALGLGGLLMGKGAGSEWYQTLSKAPWTPPGWSFGLAWTVIMICLSFYMSIAWKSIVHRDLLLIIFIIQWILNVSWNPVFFYYHQVLAGLFIIVILAMVVGFMMFHYQHQLRWASLFILPYFLWLLVAISLNAYILIKN